MCDELEILEFLESDAIYQRSTDKRKRRRLRNRSNPFDLNDETFTKRYRLSKDLVLNLCEDLRPYTREPTKSTDLTLETKVLIALSFFASGSFQRPTGDIGGHSISQSTVSTVIRQVTKLLNLPHIQTKYVKFPTTPLERRVNVQRFLSKFGMPGVLGCIGCSHVSIKRPTQNEEKYSCGNKYHSLKVQLICNANSEIISVDSNNGGATHDSDIWLNNPIKQHLEELSSKKSVWLLGDLGYPLSKYLLTPITNTTLRAQDAHYNSVHIKTRSVIDRTVGLLKARFRCLIMKKLHYEPHVAASMINACVVLHNICVRSNMPELELTEEESLEDAMQPTDNPHINICQASKRDLSEGIDVRQVLISCLWENKNTSN